MRRFSRCMSITDIVIYVPWAPLMFMIYFIKEESLSVSQQARFKAIRNYPVAGIDRLVFPPYFPALARHCSYDAFVGSAIKEDTDYESQKFTEVRQDA